MVVKTFRGLLTDSSPGNQNRIRLQTIKGKVGYRIVKFQLIPAEPGDAAAESVVQIFTEEQSTIDGKIDFTDSSLLAAGHISNSTTTYNNWSPGSMIVFDNNIFNQDIFITHEESAGSGKCNYYLELEVIPLDDAGAEYTTLKDLRQ